MIYLKSSQNLYCKLSFYGDLMPITITAEVHALLSKLNISSNITANIIANICCVLAKEGQLFNSNRANYLGAIPNATMQHNWQHYNYPQHAPQHTNTVHNQPKPTTKPKI